MNFLDCVYSKTGEQFNNIILLGEGGSGKTTSLLSLCKSLIEKPFFSEDKRILPFYIPLSEVDENDGIGHYFVRVFGGHNSLGLDASDRNHLLNDVKEKLFNSASHYIYLFLMDGANEARSIYALLAEIMDLASRPNVRIILSGKVDVDSLRDWKRIKLLPLERDTVKKYLPGMINDSNYMLLSNPFYLSNILKANSNNNESSVAYKPNIYSIIQNYIDWSISRPLESSRKQGNGGTAYLASYALKDTLNHVFPAICYSLMLTNQRTFVTNENSAKSMSWALSAEIRNHGISLSWICESILVPMGLVLESQPDTYTVTHEFYRSFFAVKFMRSDETVILDAFSHKLPVEVLTFLLYSFSGENEALSFAKTLNKTISTNQEAKATQKVNANLVRFLSLFQKDLDGFDFSGSDLSECSFQSFTSIRNSKFDGAKLSNLCFNFLGEGLMIGGASRSAFSKVADIPGTDYLIVCTERFDVKVLAILSKKDGKILWMYSPAEYSELIWCVVQQPGVLPVLCIADERVDHGIKVVNLDGNEYPVHEIKMLENPSFQAWISDSYYAKFFSEQSLYVYGLHYYCELLLIELDSSLLADSDCNHLMIAYSLKEGSFFVLGEEDGWAVFEQSIFLSFNGEITKFDVSRLNNRFICPEFTLEKSTPTEITEEYNEDPDDYGLVTLAPTRQEKKECLLDLGKFANGAICCVTTRKIVVDGEEIPIPTPYSELHYNCFGRIIEEANSVILYIESGIDSSILIYDDRLMDFRKISFATGEDVHWQLGRLKFINHEGEIVVRNGDVLFFEKENTFLKIELPCEDRILDVIVTECGFCVAGVMNLYMLDNNMDIVWVIPQNRTTIQRAQIIGKNISFEVKSGEYEIAGSGYVDDNRIVFDESFHSIGSVFSAISENTQSRIYSLTPKYFTVLPKNGNTLLRISRRNSKERYLSLPITEDTKGSSAYSCVQIDDNTYVVRYYNSSFLPAHAKQVVRIITLNQNLQCSVKDFAYPANTTILLPLFGRFIITICSGVLSAIDFFGREIFTINDLHDVIGYKNEPFEFKDAVFGDKKLYIRLAGNGTSIIAISFSDPHSCVLYRFNELFEMMALSEDSASLLLVSKDRERHTYSLKQLIINEKFSGAKAIDMKLPFNLSSGKLLSIGMLSDSRLIAFFENGIFLQGAETVILPFTHNLKGSSFTNTIGLPEGFRSVLTQYGAIGES